jgi:alpha-galactosidase
MMRHFGFYVAESSEHSAEYMPYWIKSGYPELIEQYNIPLDEYPRRCEGQIAGWEKQRDSLVSNTALEHERSQEYGSYIMDAVVTGAPARIHGNVMNAGFISNLPANTVVEVPCLVDRNGVQGVYSGPLPTQCAALNMTNINVQLLTIDAALNRSRDLVYQAAYLDPHTAAELPLSRIRQLCDDLIDAHGEFLPEFS